MNRNNIWIHIGIAVVVITFAGVLGQIRVWENKLRSTNTASKPTIRTVSTDLDRDARVTAEPEVLVRFKPGVSLAEIKRIQNEARAAQ